MEQNAAETGNISLVSGHMSQVMELWLSCYLVLLSIDSKTGNKTATVPWPDPYIVIWYLHDVQTLIRN